MCSPRSTRHYVKDLTDEQRTQLVEDMINGGLERLDRYSEFFNPDNYKKFTATSKGDFGGVGVHLGTDPKTGLPWSRAR
jgi:carboxyl-terminal processing protease